MRRSFALVVLLISLAACNSRSPAPAPPPPPAPAAEAPPSGLPPAAPPADDRCLDEKLKANHLNAYGDPDGTMYAGGSPLFDEASGRSISRRDYISRKHPELTASCPTGDGGTP